MSCTGLLHRTMCLRLLLVAVLTVSTAGLMTSGKAYALDYELPLVGAQSLATPQQQEDFEGESELPWLFAVYIITWGAFFVYVCFMGRRQRDLQRDIEALRRTLEERKRPPVEQEDS